MYKALLLVGVLVAIGCGPYLRYDGRPPAPPLAGKVVIEVHDGREPNRGGSMRQQVGQQTGSFGIPVPIRVENEETVVDTMRKIVAEAAQSAGLAVAAGEAADASSKIVIEVQRLWCTGYMPVYKADVVASLMVVDPRGAVRVPAQPLRGEDGGMNCKSLFKKSLTDVFNATQALLSQPNVKAAMLGPTFPPAQ
jgi:hypothetical protein